MAAIDLATAKAFLNISTPDNDTEITAMIDAAEAALAQWVGPLSTTTVTARVPGYGWSLHLPAYPAVSLTSVTPVNGTALTLTDLYLEKSTGAVSYNGGSFFSTAGYDVVYTAGRSPVPADLLEAVKELLKYMWSSQRGGANRPGAPVTTDQTAFPVQIGSLPPRVLALISRGHMQHTIGA